MRRLLFVLLSLPMAALAQTATSFTAGGTWSSGTWSNGVANAITFNATIASNVNVNNSYTIGDLTLNGSRTLTIPSGVTLTIGAPGNTHNFSALLSSTINVQSGGTLIIYGNFTSGSSIQLNVRGTMTVNGNFTLGGSGNVDASPSGTITVTGTTTAGAGSQLQNGGTFKANGGCTGAAAFCSAGNLPVQLRSFEVTAGSGVVELMWSTASELNNDYFTIERSRDGFEFESLGKVAGKGTTADAHDYYYADYFPLLGRSWYRLVQVDFDGKQTLLPVQSVELQSLQRLSIAPNPIEGDKLVYQVSAAPGEEVQVMVRNSMGQVVGTWMAEAQKSEIPVNLASGVYFLTIRGKNGSSSARFVVK